MSCDKVEKDNELGIWDENQDYGKILYFSSSRILVKKMGKRWSHRKSDEHLQFLLEASVGYKKLGGWNWARGSFIPRDLYYKKLEYECAFDLYLH